MAESNAEPTQFQSISTRRTSEELPPLLLPALLGDPQPPSPGRKSPAYLDGKNPYGRILDNVEHPYQETKDTKEAPSQAGASIQGRPRTSGAFEFKTRPTPVEPELLIVASNLDLATSPSRQPEPTLLGLRQLSKPVSVQAAKKFFESKTIQSGSLPSGSIANLKERSTHKTSDDQLQEVAAQEKLPQISNSTRALLPEYNMSDVILPIPRPPPESSRQVEPSRRINPFARPKTESLAPEVILRKPTARTKSPTTEDGRGCSGADGDEQTVISRRRSTNIFETAPHDAKPVGFERRAFGDSSERDEVPNAPLIAVEEIKRTKEHRDAEEIVRHTFLHTAISAAETEAATVSDGPEAQQTIRRSQSGGDVRRAFKETKSSSAAGYRRHGSQGIALTDANRHDRQVGRVASQRPMKSANPAPGHKSDIYPNKPDRSVDVRRRVEDIAARGLSYDGSSSDPCPSRGRDTRKEVSPGNIGVQAGYFEIEVPDDIEWRGAHGRRETQDFGCV
jgi:hypothetical protein